MNNGQAPSHLSTLSKTNSLEVRLWPECLMTMAQPWVHMREMKSMILYPKNTIRTACAASVTLHPITQHTNDTCPQGV